MSERSFPPDDREPRTSGGRLVRRAGGFAFTTDAAAVERRPTPTRAPQEERLRIELLHPAIGLAAFPLREGDALVLGRGGADVELGWDAQVSRRHARVELRGGRLSVEDLGSRNGVWRESARVAEATFLQPGQEVLIGDTVLRFERVSEDDPFAEVTRSELEDVGPAASTVDLRSSTSDLRVIITSGSGGVAPSAALAEADRWPAFAPSTSPAPVLASSASRASSPGVAWPGLAPPPRAVPPSPPPPPPVVEPTRIPAPRASRLIVQLGNGGLQLTYVDLGAFEAAFRSELARGALLVPTSARLAAGTRLALELRQPGGVMFCDAQVVQTLPPGAMGLAEGGVALEFCNLDRDVLRMLPSLEAQPGFELLSRALARDTRAPQLDAAFERAKALIAAVERGDHYGALELTPEAADDAIRAKLAAVELALTVPLDAPHTPQVARVRAAQERLARLATALGDPARRLEHDFRSGFVRAPDRIARARAGAGPSLEVLRRAWHQVHPVKVERAAFHTRKAFAASQVGDYDTAIKAARAALEENPFFDELRPTIAGWERSKKSG